MSLLMYFVLIVYETFKVSNENWSSTKAAVLTLILTKYQNLDNHSIKSNFGELKHNKIDQKKWDDAMKKFV